MIYNEEFETLPREALKALQLKRLQQVLQRAYHTVGFYKKSLDAAKITPDDIKSTADIKKLPFITRKDMRDNYPYGLFSVPMSSIVRLHASSGTSVIPMSGGNAKRQIMILQDFGPTAICCTPSYALYLAEEGKAMGVDMKSLKLRVGIFGAEPWNKTMRDEIEKVFGITALDLFGLSEVIGPGIAMECLEGRNGMHIFEDHFLVETINPQTGEVLPEGAEGELVFTTLTKEANPLIRYRSGDVSRLITDPCRCGRTHINMERVLKRSDDMLIIRGVNIFPAQVAAILVDIEGLKPNYQIIVDKVGALDSLELHVEASDTIFSDSGSVKELQKIEQRIVKDMKDYLGIAPGVKLVEPNTLQKAGAKVIDKRRY